MISDSVDSMFLAFSKNLSPLLFSILFRVDILCRQKEQQFRDLVALRDEREEVMEKNEEVQRRVEEVRERGMELMQR